MTKYTEDKKYIYYENSNVPKNKLDIRDLKILEAKERDLLLYGYEYFHKNLKSSTTFDEKYLKRLHSKTFGPLFEFAGKYRTVNVSKGYSTFCQVRFLQQTSEGIFDKLKTDNYLRGFSDKPTKQFAKKIAFYICELTALHPFFEFNGRIIRLFFDMIATYNGYNYIDYKDALKLEDGQNLFVQASIDCMTANGSKMLRLFSTAYTKQNNKLIIISKNNTLGAYHILIRELKLDNRTRCYLIFLDKRLLLLQTKYFTTIYKFHCRH